MDHKQIEELIVKEKRNKIPLYPHIPSHPSKMGIQTKGTKG